MFPRILLDMCYKSLADIEGLVQSTPPQFQGYQYFSMVTMWHFCCILTLIQRVPGHTNIHTKSCFWGNLYLVTGTQACRSKIPSANTAQAVSGKHTLDKAPDSAPGLLLVWALLTPLSVLREVNSRNPAQAPHFLSKTVGGKLVFKNEHMPNQTFYGGKEGWRVFCSPFRADAAQALLLLPMLHRPLRSEPNNWDLNT